MPLMDYEENYYRNPENKDLNVNVYMSVGGEEEEPYFLRPIRKFVKRLSERDYEGLNLIYKEYEGMGHYDVWVPTLLDGLAEFLK